MYVVATAGHVDHGKSTLVKALTGMEPDRWEAERRRGLTIDLGFVWTTLPSGREVGFVDVPGHERSWATCSPDSALLPSSASWSQPTGLDGTVVRAPGCDCRAGDPHGLVVISRADRAAPERVAEVIAQTRRELSDTGLAEAPVVVVSAVAGTGMVELVTTLDAVLGALPAPRADGPVRLWVDRAFTITGAGTVLTGTLPAGTLTAGDRLELLGGTRTREVTVRGLQTHGRDCDVAGPVSRVAVNVRGVSAVDVHRGDALVTPGTVVRVSLIDVRRTSGGGSVPELPHRACRVGGRSARSRSFDDDHHRSTLASPLPLHVGDQLVLRDPGQAGSSAAPGCSTWIPPLRRRGDGVRRGEDLAFRDDDSAVGQEVARRGAVERSRLAGRDSPSKHCPTESRRSAAGGCRISNSTTGRPTACAAPWWHCTSATRSRPG